MSTGALKNSGICLIYFWLIMVLIFYKIYTFDL